MDHLICSNASFALGSTSSSSMSLELVNCIAQRIFPWIPIAFMCILMPFDIYYSFAFVKFTAIASDGQVQGQNPRTTLLRIAKYWLIILLIIAEITSLVHIIATSTSSDENVETVPSDYYALKFAKSVAFIVVFCAMCLSSSKGILSSGIQFNFWVLCCANSGVQFYVEADSSPSRTLEFAVEAIEFSLLFCLILLLSWAELGRAPNKAQRPCPNVCTSFLSRLTYSYFTSLIWKSHRRPGCLAEENLWDLNPTDKSEHLFRIFENYQNLSHNTQRFKISKILLKIFWPSLLFGALMKLCQDLCLFGLPLILGWIISFTKDQQLEISGVDEWKGYFYIGLLFLVISGHSLASAQHLETMSVIGMRLKTILTGYSSGEVVNIVSIDVPRIVELLPILNLIWSGPLQIVLCGVFLWNILGISTLAILGLILLLVPASGVLIFRLRKLQLSQMDIKDERTKRMCEILSGIKVLKMYVWESAFENQILKLRDDEMKTLRKASVLSAGLVFVWTCTPFLVSLATFATFVLIDDGNVLDAETVFVSLTLFNIMRQPLSMLPTTVNALVQAKVSFNRLNEYIKEDDETIENSFKDDKHLQDIGDRYAISIKNGNFSWHSSNPEEEAVPTILKEINLSIRKNSLVVIRGSIGSGKTSLLTAILGGLKRTSGQVIVEGSIAYVSQQVWLQNASVQENILLGSPFDIIKYKNVIKACALTEDLAAFPHWDKTLVGEKGITLSGGQKQRISLARAVYADADIYLLDDPISAVDTHVGQHILEKVIGPSGLLHHKTRLLTTNTNVNTPKADQTIYLQNGFIRERQQSDSQVYHCSDDIVSDNVVIRLGRDTSSCYPAMYGNSSFSNLKRNSFVRGSRRRMSSTQSILHEIQESDDEEGHQAEQHSEQIQEGNVGFSVYQYYAKSLGWLMATSAFIFHVVHQGFGVASSFWLLAWSTIATENANATQDTSQRNMYLGVYISFGAFQAMSILVGSILLVLATLKAANQLHAQMLNRILRAPLYFFDTNPTGRILNRFGKDVDICDTMLPRNFRSFLLCLLYVMSCLGIICYTTQIFLATALPAILLYTLIQRYHVTTARQLKRLEAISRSPIISQFMETMCGTNIILAFGVQSHFIKELEKRVDRNQITYFYSIIAERWLALRLETIGNILVICATTFVLYFTNGLNPGMIGLALSSAFEITQSLNMLMRMLSDVESNMVAVERIKEYTEIDQEVNWITESTATPPKEWPHNGCIEFNSLKARYKNTSDPVLKDLSFRIAPNEKIGIVGRTGSGKSSLIMALLRLLEAESGSITIDGVDISKVGLQQIRRQITVIPQDSVFFEGTLRMNLDPTGKNSDENIWRALEMAHLKLVVSALSEGLDYELGQDGDTFSAGQRQLLCLCRALLRQTKILLLDEATASVDLATDDLIQETIRSEFKNCTVLTIAHRLNTIMSSSRVLVLDAGRICEFASPTALLNDKNSIFYSMAKDSGLLDSS